MRSSAWGLAGAAFAALLLGACKADIDGTSNINVNNTCAPRTLVTCACPGGTLGSHQCGDDGLPPATCNCGGAGQGGGVAGMGTGVAGTGIAGTGVGQSGTGGILAQAGTGGVGGSAAGTGGESAGTGGGGGTGGDGGNLGMGETGRLVGITAAHNAARAAVSNPTPNPAIPPLMWSESLAMTAQAYANKLATTGGCKLVHSMAPGLGENLAWYSGSMASVQDVVDGWASESACWTYGKFMQGDNCDATCAQQHYSNGCGHYTQVVWRKTTMVGCGEADCPGSPHAEIWVCNYTPQGNYIGQDVY